MDPRAIDPKDDIRPDALKDRFQEEMRSIEEQSERSTRIAVDKGRWELIDKLALSNGEGGKLNEMTFRMKIPSGWIVRTVSVSTSANAHQMPYCQVTSIEQIEDKEHTWQ